MKYLIPCALFLLNNEVFSWLALLILMGVFLVDCWRSHEEVRG